MSSHELGDLEIRADNSPARNIPEGQLIAFSGSDRVSIIPGGRYIEVESPEVAKATIRDEELALGALRQIRDSGVDLSLPPLKPLNPLA